MLETVAAYLVGANYEGLTNSYMTAEQRATLDPHSAEWAHRVAGSKIQVLGWSLYVAILWLIKYALAVFYSRLTTGLQNLPQRVRIAYIILGVSWLATQLSVLLSCQPFHAFWQINPNPGSEFFSPFPTMNNIGVSREGGGRGLSFFTSSNLADTVGLR